MLWKMRVEFNREKTIFVKKSRKICFGLITIPEKKYCAASTPLFDDYYSYFNGKLREIESQVVLKDFENQEQCEKYMRDFVNWQSFNKLDERFGERYKIIMDFDVYSTRAKDLPISEVMKLLTIEEFQKEFGNLDINFLSKQCKGE